MLVTRKLGKVVISGCSRSHQMISYESQHSARFSATLWKSARWLTSGVGTGAKVRRYRKHDEHRKVEGARPDATSIRQSNVVMLFITS